MSNYHQKKIAMINDLSGYGRCSLTVALPILSAMRIQCCPVPTSILSNHTGFPVWFFDDYTDKMEQYIGKWKELDLTFDGIVTGFLGSKEQIRIVADMIKDFRRKDTQVIVDPIMGDHGKAYSTYTPEMCREMERLVRLADVVTPNVTEGCILTGREYRSQGWSRRELEQMALDIQKMGPSSVIITGIGTPKSLTNVILKSAAASRDTFFASASFSQTSSSFGSPVCSFQRSTRAGGDRPGTGDVFSSIIAGGVIQGWDLEETVKLAAWFIRRCIIKSDELDIPRANGVCFEEILPELILKCRKKYLREKPQKRSFLS